MRKGPVDNSVTTAGPEGFIVSHLLHRTAHFGHPTDVLCATHLSAQEKRAILASWASDQYTVESIPTLRHYPGSSGEVSLAEVLAALGRLTGTRTRNGRRQVTSTGPGGVWTCVAWRRYAAGIARVWHEADMAVAKRIEQGQSSRRQDERPGDSWSKTTLSTMPRHALMHPDRPVWLGATRVGQTTTILRPVNTDETMVEHLLDAWRAARITHLFVKGDGAMARTASMLRSEAAAIRRFGVGNT